jgi:hypothetical protein
LSACRPPAAVRGGAAPARWLCTLLLLAPLAGGAVSQTPRLREASADWGLVHRHHHGGSGRLFMPETMGAGVVVFDYDGDGDPDVLFLDSGVLPGYRGEPPRTVLYRNEGGGRFHDVPAAAGIVPTTYVMGGTAGDVDGDGDLDLYLSGFGPGQLFRNEGTGTFRDATAEAGVGRPGWGASAAFADPDGDGDLDLFVSQYVDFRLEENPPCGDAARGLRSYCHPDVFRGLPDHYYRNEGGGRFVAAEAEAGLGGDTGNGLGVVFADLDGDGHDDLYVANDMTPAFLHRNRGGRFEEVGMLAGVALSDLGKPEAGMGVAVGDVDGNGWDDLFKTHLDLQANALYLNQGGLLFIDGRYTSKLAEPSLYLVGFGAELADLDHDADLDLLVANGHIIHNVEAYGTGATYRQRNQLFVNLGGGAFAEVRDGGPSEVRSSRGLATGDLDGDGDLDVVVTNNDDLAEVYENVSASAGGWLQVDLAAASGNTAGIGASIELVVGDARQRRQVRTSASYLSQSALGAHFGLGSAARVELLVRWPDGRRLRYRGVPASHRLRLFAAH